MDYGTSVVIAMKKVYIVANSKKHINLMIDTCDDGVYGIEYNAFNPGGYETRHNLFDFEEDVVVAIRRSLDAAPHVWGTYRYNHGLIE